MNEELLKFTIERFDHYYDTVNNKVNFFIAFNTFVCSAVIISFESLSKFIADGLPNIFFITCVLFIFFASLLSIYYALSALMPYTKHDSNSIMLNNYHSLISFKSIASMNETDFLIKAKELTEEGKINDLLVQSYKLAGGLNAKFTRLTYSGYALFAEIFLLIPILILIVFFHK